MTTLASSSSLNSTAIRSPSNLPLNQSDAVTSLLSLGMAAAGTAPIPIRSTSSNQSTTSTTSLESSSGQRTVEGTAGSLSTTLGFPGSLSAAGVDNRAISVGPPGSTTTIANGGKHHRRLGSTGKTRRRLSDAREASARPILASPPASSGLLSLSSLSLSTSPGKPLAPRPPSTSLSGISIAALTGSAPIAIPISGGSLHAKGPPGNESTSLNDMDIEAGSVKSGSTPIPISSGKQKKRGVDYKCESCSKIYRHPNCLNKHRWEHTRQWREASKFVLSKHQQVQLLEAATILSFMGDGATSLPEDRSQWPTFLSGGSLPKVEPMGTKEHKPSSSISSASGLSSAFANMPISSSVPARMTTSTSMGGGPRMHDYTLPHSSSGVGVVGRPGLVGVSNMHRHHHHTRSMSASSTAGLSTSLSADVDSTIGQSSASGLSMTLPSTSVRSESSGSGSGSGSSGAEEEEPDIDIDVEVMDTEGGEDYNEKGLRRIENAAPPTIKATKSYPVPVSAPLGYGSYGRSASYGSYGGATTTPGFGSYGANGGYTTTGYQSAAAGYAPSNPYGSYGSGSFGTRRMHGPGALMKREDDEMSVGFSVKEEDENVEEEEEEEADDSIHLKKVNERRWDGMEMEVDMDMD
ncbi:hypothetical protein CPB83DRAFT_833554 [Crepidotus variabilis]|uniref:C2H2-type domain-containing protein n=1 Tax=Crepidotus variabilis TaxID=179855 RepID=A0A9P6ELP5_9AGAR|nr:hypothetical protein CPB83DRAFT_833554 [Crepidotus variabilis]